MKKNLFLVVAVAALVCVAGPAPAQTVLAGTSFEVVSAPGGQYFDLDDPNVDHPLQNNPGEPEVNFVAAGGEIGYTSYYWDTRGEGIGLSDGDWVGPTTFVGDVGSFPDGSQGFGIGDPDGRMTVTMDAVDFTGIIDPLLSVEWFVNEDGWEAEDVLRIWVTADPGAVEIDLLNTVGNDIDDLAIEGFWMHSEVDLTGYTSATLAFEVDSNSGFESMYIDKIQLTGINEADVIFLDNFESGNFDSWSSSLP